MAKQTKQKNYEIKSYLEQLKKEKRVTSKDIAAALGVSPQTVTALLMTADQMSITQLIKLAEVFKVHPFELLKDIAERSDIQFEFVFQKEKFKHRHLSDAQQEVVQKIAVKKVALKKVIIKKSGNETN